MTPTEADSRIILSRQHLHRYMAADRAGQLPMGDGRLVSAEIALLEGIAEQHPGKAAKIERLIQEWTALGARMRGAMH